MKIDDVALTLFEWSGIPPTKYGLHTGSFRGSSQLGLLTIRTDGGVEGHAFLGAASRPASLDAQSMMDRLKPVLMGQDPLDRERLYRDMCRHLRTTTYRAVGAADVALWDIAGKVAGLPIYQLLGAARRSLPAYASSPVLPSKAEYVAQAKERQEGGWAAYKIHPPAEWR
ncbi:MAG: mandelate racemase, partial [Geminicoccales bacterium]